MNPFVGVSDVPFWSRTHGRDSESLASARSDQLTQSSRSEEAGEDEQACGPHGLLFFPPAAEGPSQSVLAIPRLWCLFQGTLPSTLKLLTPSHESGNLSGGKETSFGVYF